MAEPPSPPPSREVSSAVPAPFALSLLARTLGIDSRSLVLFRIGLGLMLLIDTILRARDLSAHYTDSGVLPRNVWIELYGNSGIWSLHLFSGDTGWVTALFLFTAVAGAGLIVGWHTRIMALLGWLLLLSINFRNPLITNNGDTLMVVLLMWAIFLPVGLFGSFDGLPRLAEYRKTRLVLRGATAGVLLQIVIAYFVAGYTKLTDPWMTGVALEQALSLGSYQSGLARVMLDYPTLLHWTALVVPWLEMILPALALLPVWRWRLRLAIIGFFVVFHAGIAMTLTVGWFSWASVLAWTLFLPPTFWDFFARREWIAGPWQRMSAFLHVALGRFVAHPYPVSPHSARRLADVVSLALLAFVFVMAAHVCGDWVHGRPLVSAPVERVAYALDLGQKWTQFSIPRRDDGWFILVVEFRDGTKIDVLSGEPFRGLEGVTRPDRLSGIYPNQRWRKYFDNLGGERFKPFRVRLPYAVAQLAKPYETHANPIAYGEAYAVRITHDEHDQEQIKLFKIFGGNLPYIEN